jgi:hypothetical protein
VKREEKRERKREAETKSEASRALSLRTFVAVVSDREEKIKEERINWKIFIFFWRFTFGHESS